MSHSLAGEPPAAGRHATPPTTTPYSTAEWSLLTGLPGRVVAVAAAAAPGRPLRGVAAGLAGLEAVAAGRIFDSDLVRAVVATIYARHDEGAAPSARLGRHRLRRGSSATDPVGLLTDCRTATRLLRRRADPADSAVYRQWLQSIAARVCRAGLDDSTLHPADQRFLDRLGAALGLR